MPNRLGDTQIDHFIEDGFVKIEGAFPKEIAAQARSILWKDTSCDPDDPATWIKPVIRLSDYPEQPFRIAANTPVLHRAFDQLVGPGRWLARKSLGSFPSPVDGVPQPLDQKSLDGRRLRTLAPRWRRLRHAPLLVLQAESLRM